MFEENSTLDVVMFFLFSGQGGTVSCASQCASQCGRSKSLQAMENLLTKL